MKASLATKLGVFTKYKTQIITQFSLKMLSRLARNTLRRVYSSNATVKKFVVRPKQKSSKWVPFTIFGGSFFLGWLLTEHMTFTDLMAYWRYDSLPQGSEEIKDYQLELFNRSENLPVVRQLQQVGFREVFPQRRKDDLLIDKALFTPGAIAVPPRFYYNPLTKESVGIYHLGMKLTGYPFIIHGGILATVIEDFMRECVKFAKGKEGERTKDLSISYKLPTLANQFVIVRTTKVDEFGKNVKIKVEVMDQSGNRKLLNGTGVFKS